jgi:hypothetical protein
MTPVKGVKEISESAKSEVSEKIIINEKTENINNIKEKEPLGPLEAHLTEKIEMLNNQFEKQLNSIESEPNNFDDFYSAAAAATTNINNNNNINNNFRAEDNNMMKQIVESKRLPVFLEAIRDDILCNYVYESDLPEENLNGLSGKEKGFFDKHLRKNNSNYIKDLKNGVSRNTSTEQNENNYSDINNNNNNINNKNDPEAERILNSIDPDLNSTLENLNNIPQDIYKVKKNANTKPKQFKLSQFINTAANIADILYESLPKVNNKTKAYPFMLFEIYKIHYFHCILNLIDEEKAQATFDKLLNIFKKFSIEAHFEYYFNLSVTRYELQILNKAGLIYEFLNVLEQKLKIESETTSDDFEKIIELSAFLGNYYVQHFENDKAVNLLQNTLGNLNKLANNEIENSKINLNAKYNSFIKIYRLLANLYGNTNELEKSKVLCMKALEINNKINNVEFVFNLFDFNYTLASLATRPYLYLQDFIQHFNNIKNFYLQIFEDEPNYGLTEGTNVFEHKEKMKDLVNNNKGMEIFGEKKVTFESDSESDKEKAESKSENNFSKNKINFDKKIYTQIKADVVTQENLDDYSNTVMYNDNNNINSATIDFQMEKNLLNNTNKFSEINQKIKSIKRIYANDQKFEEIKVNILLGYMHLIYVLLRHREHTSEVDPAFENETEEDKRQLNRIMIKDILDLNEITLSKFFNEKIGLNYIIDWKVVLGEYCFKYNLYEQAVLLYVDLLTIAYYDAKVKYMIYIDNVEDPIDFILKRLIELSVYIKTEEVQRLYEKTLNMYEIIKR